MGELRDKAILELEIETEGSKRGLQEAETELKKVNNELRAMKAAGQEGSEGWKEAKLRQAELTEETIRLKRNLDLNDASLKELKSSLSFYTREMNGAKVGSEEYIAAAAKVSTIKEKIKDVTDEAKALNDTVDSQVKSGGVWDNFKVTVAGIFTGGMLLEGFKQLGSAAMEFGMDIFEITGRFQRYEAVLTNALGSQEKAAQAMDMLKKLAAETPFGVDELTESYVKYVNRGIQPTAEEITKLGDIAASQGKSMDQLTEAVLDAQTGEFERLKEFGIRASKSGDEVSLSFKGITETVKMTDEAILEALLGFGEMEGVAGGMAMVSQTLEGRVSNLGDSFDNVKLIIGDLLLPVFNTILDLMAGGIDLIGDLLSGNLEFGESTSWLSNILDGLGRVLQAVWDVLVSVGGVLWDTISAIGGFVSSTSNASLGGKALELVLDALAFAVRAVGAALIIAVGSVQALFDSFNVLINKGKELINLLAPGSFKIDPAATFENVAKNAEANLKKVSDLFVGTYSKAESDAKKANTEITAHANSAQQSQTATQATESKKRQDNSKKEADAIKASNQKLTKELEDMQVKSIADDTKRAIAKENLDYQRRMAAINKEKADITTKNKALEALEKSHETALEKIKSDAEKKEAKRKSDAEKADAAHLKKLGDAAKKYADEDEKLNQKLFDNKFKQAVADAKLNLDLTTKNSTEMWAAKRVMLDAEMAYKQQKLQTEAANEIKRINESLALQKARLTQEAADERQRLAESISNKTQRDAAIARLDADLQSKIKASEQSTAALVNQTETQLATNIKQLATETANKKKALNAEQLADRKAKTTEFYSALNTAMQGDMTKFMEFMLKKDTTETNSLQTRLKANTEHITGVVTAMTTAVNGLMELNKKYTDDRVAKLKLESDKNKERLEKEFNDGTITKEQLDSALTASEAKFQADALAEKKKGFERDKKLKIANALMAGSLAVLSALAMPWPVGIAMAVLAGVKAAVDITKIKNQKFEARDGYVHNAGILSGPRHGQNYGESGISMINRETGEEVGEAEGGEAFMILSRNTVSNNGGVIRRLVDSSLNRNGAPIKLERGGVVPISAVDSYMRVSYRNPKMWEDGYISEDLPGSDAAANEAHSKEIIAKNEAMSKEQLDTLKKTLTASETSNEKLTALIAVCEAIRAKPTGISLHDLNSALSSAVSAGRKANMVA
jgi:hypothetical protein